MSNFLEKLQVKLISFIKLKQIPILSSPKVLKLIEIIVDIKFARYLFIGFSTFGLYFLTYQILLQVFDGQKLTANMIASLISMSFNFTSSNFWTFKKSRKNFKKKILKYGGLQIFNYSFNNTAFYFLVIQLHLKDILAMVMITGMIVCWNFLLYRFSIFKQ